MRAQLLFIFFLVVFIESCKDQPEKSLIPTTSIDTTITVQNAFTRLKLDSQLVHQYIEQSADMSDTAKQLFANFYNSRNFQYAWFDENGRTEHAGMIWNLYTQYLVYTRDTTKADKFLSEQVQQVIAGDTSISLDAKTIRKSELELTHLFFNYTFAAYLGKVKPEDLQWYIPRRKMDVASLLDSLISAKGISAHEWEPIHPQYALIRSSLIYLNNLERKGGWSVIETGKNIKFEAGAKDSIIFHLKKRLQVTGNYPLIDTSTLFTNELKDSLKKVQSRFGLVPNGIISKSTIDALNVPVEERIRQLLINLERARWLPRQPSGDWIHVNIPSFRLRVFENDSSSLQMKIVVGTSANRTVIFSDVLRYIVFSPYWNVPPSIVRNEIIPSIRKNPNYLQKSNMEQTGTSNGLPVIRQKPGKSNALGQVKFLFPNNYNIYLHDTPAKSYFNENSRAFSHGCIRISEPFTLAKYLLRRDSSWTDKKIQGAMKAGKEQWVNLKTAVPVFITYFTAWVDEGGQLQFRNDIYGHDTKMAEQLFSKN